MRVARTLLSFLCVVIGLAATCFAVPATWTNTHLMDTDEWTAAVGPLIEEEEVRGTVTRALVQAIDSEGRLPTWGRDLLTSATAEVVATDAFAQVWEDAVRIAHVQLVEAIRDEGTGIAVADDAIAVDLAALHGSLVPRLTEAGVPMLDLLPVPEGQIVLEDSARTAAALDAAGVVDAWAWPAAAVALTAFAAAIVVARRRAATTLTIGVLVAAVGGLGLLLWRGVEAGWRDGAAGSTGRTVLAALTESVDGWLTVVLGLGAGTALLGVLLLVVGRLSAPLSRE